MKMEPILSATIETADAANSAEDDYINPEDGLIYCGKCHTPKEAFFPEKHRFNGLEKHPTDCNALPRKRNAARQNYGSSTTEIISVSCALKRSEIFPPLLGVLTMPRL